MLNMCSALTKTSARQAIVEASLRRFAAEGIASTSLRAVARDAGVSPALVVHHFSGKEGLIAAADEAVVREFGDAFAAEEPREDGDLLRRRATQTARVMRDKPEVCAYLGRALVERTDGGAALFRAMIDGGRAEVDSLAGQGALRPDADLLWATLQHFFLIWAPLSFMPLLEETLGGPLLEPAQLDRWVEANVELLSGGLYR
jgi:AcrR family transcriptional regulator